MIYRDKKTAKKTAEFRRSTGKGHVGKESRVTIQGRWVEVGTFLLGNNKSSVTTNNA